MIEIDFICIILIIRQKDQLVFLSGLFLLKKVFNYQEAYSVYIHMMVTSFLYDVFGRIIHY